MRTIHLATFAALVITGTVAQVEAAPITNGGFESGDFTGWSTTGVTSVETGAYGTGPTSGTYQALMTTGSGSVSDTSIEAFLGLPAGTLDSLSTGNATEGSAIKQTVMGNAGQILSFKWNFLTNEATPTGFNDFAFWSLVNQQNGEVLADTFNPTFVGSATPFNEETGFNMKSFVLTSSGTFTLGFGVMDVNDGIVDSGLLIDGVSITGAAVPEPSLLALSGITMVGMAIVSSARHRRRKKQHVTA